MAKEFNYYEVRNNVTVIFLQNNLKEVFETEIDTKNLEKVKSLGLHWHLRYNPHTKSYYAKSTRRTKQSNGKIKSESVYLHIEILNPEHDKSIYVDHKNHNTLNNKESNLRYSTNSENNKHRKEVNVNNNSGYRNVSFIRGYWRVQLQINGKNHMFPEKFTDVDSAGQFAQKMRKKYYGSFAGNG